MKGSIVQKRKGSRNWYAIIERRDDATGKRVRHGTVMRLPVSVGHKSNAPASSPKLKNDTLSEPSRIVLRNSWSNGSII